MAIEFAQIIGPLAKSLLGEPNKAMSSAAELRYGAHGSFSVDLVKGTWYDHEAEIGGGALDLVTRETRLEGQDRLDWLKRHGFIYETLTNGAHPPRARIIETYDYHDQNGTLLFQVCRFEPKDFRQRRPDPHEASGWTWSVKGIKHVPYKLPQLLENEDRVICIVEGEKDVDRLWAIGVPATCNPGGAGKWRDELTEYFQGADVVIIPDRDPQKKHPKTGEPLFHPDGRPILPGQDHAQMVAAALQGTATRVRVLELWKHWAAMPPKGDTSDWLAQGGTAEALYALIERTPTWTGQRSDEPPVPLLFPFPIDGAAIPRRKWIVPGLLLRRNVSLLVAPPGSGKSLLTLQMGLMMSSGRPWGGWFPRQPAKVLIINGEDDADEMRRRLYAACHEMKIGDWSMLRERLAIADESAGRLVIAKADARSKTVIAQPMAKRLEQTVLEHGFDVLVVDPFAETFEGDENSNSELKWAAVLWREIARRTNAAVMLVHHTRKFNAEAGDMDSARGGGALVGVTRIVSTLFQMTEEEAVVYDIKPDERHQYLRFDDAKANLTLVTFKARWFQKKTVELPNAGDEGEPADEVGVLLPWEPKGIFARCSDDVFNAILDVIAAGVRDKNGEPTGDLMSSSNKGMGNKRWAGIAIMAATECSKQEAQGVIDQWLKSGLLIQSEQTTSTSKGKLRKGLLVDNSKRPGVVVSRQTKMSFGDEPGVVIDGEFTRATEDT